MLYYSRLTNASMFPQGDIDNSAQSTFGMLNIKPIPTLIYTNDISTN